jgi:transcription elongation factor Elf1
MDGPDWLRLQLTSFNCPACGRRYRDTRVDVLAEREGLFFVDLDCAECGSRTVAIITVDQENAGLSVGELQPVTEVDDRNGETLPSGAAPVTADDVLDMHEFLARYEGDVKGLLRSGVRRQPGA